MNILTDLFLTFAKIGLFTFGGGYAMIALIEDSCVTRKSWITHDEMMNMTVVAESTPGPIAINCATFVGYKKAGLLGALIATLGIVLPSFAIIFAISMCLDHFLDLPLIASAFKGIKIAVGVLILDAALTMIKKMPSSKPCPPPSEKHAASANHSAPAARNAVQFPAKQIKPFPRAVMLCAFAAMLAVNLFSLNFSSVSLMLIAGLVSLSLFIAKGAPNMKGGEGK